MGHVFISYSRANEAYVRTLSIDMRRRGFDVWMDDRVDYGSVWNEMIIEAIETCSAFVLVISPDSDRSEWVERETMLAQRAGKVLLPLLLEGRQLPQTTEIEFTDVTGGRLPDDAFYARLAKLTKPRARTGMLVTPPEVQVRKILAEDDQPPARPSTPRPPQSTRRVSGVALIGMAIVFVLMVSGAWLILTSRESAHEAALGRARAFIGSNDDWEYYSELFDGVEMMLVPTGCFMMVVPEPDAGEPDQRETCLEAFWIDRTEVTNQTFAQLDGEATTDPNWSGSRYPREQISWDEARDFCIARGGSLPTEAQWAYAARGPASNLYPWGETFVPDNVAYAANSGNRTVAVGSHPHGDSWVGVLDMVGNVWEWVDDSETLDDGVAYRVVRGGAWDTSLERQLQATTRLSRDPAFRREDQGFRCVLPLE